MELLISPLPCMPIPIIPKRTRSLGAAVCGIAQTGVGSSWMAFPAMVAPAAPAVRPMKLRREYLRVMGGASRCGNEERLTQARLIWAGEVVGQGTGIKNEMRGCVVRGDI